MGDEEIDRGNEEPIQGKSCTEFRWTSPPLWLIANIVDYPLPPKFKIPQLESFDRFKDLLDYLETFKTIIQLQAVPK